MKKVFAFIFGLMALSVPASAEMLSYLIEERVTEEFGFELPVGGEFDIRLVNVSDAEAVVVPDFWYDKNTGQFIANVVMEDGLKTRVTGLATLTVPVPVPVRKLMPDEIVTEADLQVVPLPHNRVGGFVLTTMNDIVGMEVKRVLTRGRPVMKQSVTPPIIVDRGDRVEIVYTKGRMNLSAPGKAIGSAAKGEEVRIVNVVSNKTVVAIATEEGKVEIMN
ncbi:flagellar basal body P-ring formation chaperone FlgA [Sulfitobacter sp. R18_1]|uniref:flagellar basal body P-ring formation chaperone FlgA n=1 Tax=Sulfitobacter sp. R18_1 TaxID=2821104 RepID=UPI001ADCD236|nr:flagellar basal body P-ring formation chaperone FlgA [Sulfitobacter sp. R18_1]MBO9428646.1 flagellar basal body P-ring formation protein FlgA [Sulfitobacter sp. R18_1]